MDEERRSSKWTGFVLFLFFLYLFGRPTGERILEAVGQRDTQWREMVQAINGVTDSYDGEVGIYIKNIQTGQIFERNADQKFIAASLIKLPIMAAVFQAVRDKRISLTATMTLKSRNRRWGSGKMKWVRAGRKFPVTQVIYRMITDSDNTATQMLIDRFGYDYLNFCFKNYGFKVTRIHPEGMSLKDRVSARGDNYTTPKEMAMLLEKIYRRQLINDGYSDLMLEIMKDVEGKTRLRKYLPENWAFARKGGLLRKNCHDVGIVFTPNADYIICVLTRKNGSYGQAKSLIANVGKTAYTFIGRS